MFALYKKGELRGICRRDSPGEIMAFIDGMLYVAAVNSGVSIHAAFYLSDGTGPREDEILCEGTIQSIHSFLAGIVWKDGQKIRDLSRYMPAPTGIAGT